MALFVKHCPLRSDPIDRVPQGVPDAFLAYRPQMILREFRRGVWVKIFLRDPNQCLRYEVPHTHSWVNYYGVTFVQDGRDEDLQLAVFKVSYLFHRKELLEELKDVIVRVFWIIKKEVP